MSVLEVQGLTKRFGRTEALRDVSFAVERGEVHGLLGPNGAGKTTALVCALGLERPTKGSARVLDIPARRMHETRGRVGVVFDAANLIDGLSVRDNLEYARRLLGHTGGREAAEAMRLVGIESLGARRAGRLSLGQKKRVAVARALLGRPELLVLDEPLAALDTLGVDALLRLFRKLAREDVTVVLSSHRLPEMERVITHATILSEGRVAATGALDALLESDSTTLEIRASRATVAERVLREHATILSTAPIEGDVASFVVRIDRDRSSPASTGRPAGDTGAVAAVNRALVEAGCDVSAIVPERGDLAAVFGRLVAPDDRATREAE